MLVTSSVIYWKEADEGYMQKAPANPFDISDYDLTQPISIISIIKDCDPTGNLASLLQTMG